MVIPYITTTRSSHDFKLMHTTSHLLIVTSIQEHAVPEWNTLPSNIVSEPTLNKFKNLLYI